MCRSIVFMGLLALGASAPALAQVITLEPPGEREFIVDRADLITPEHEQRIRQIADRLLTDTASPIIVVTVEDLARHSRRGPMSIETFAKTLFDQWGIGHLTINGRASNTGVLVLVARDDRKARIELGVGWSYDKEAAAQQIMNERMVPRFRSGDYSGGILAGVESLDQLARGGISSASGGGSRQPASSGRGAAPGIGVPGVGGLGGLLGCGGIGLVVVLVLMRMLGGGLANSSRRRRGGWGMLGPALFGGMMMGGLGRSASGGFSRGGGSSGGFSGGFSGGSFGRGFSGGRGASGSW